MKKQWFLSVLALCMLASMAFGCATNGLGNSSDQNSQTESGSNGEGLEYTLSSDGTYYSVTGIGTCTDTDVVIPESYA